MSASRFSLRPSFCPEPPESNPELTRSHRKAAWSDVGRARAVTFAVHLMTLALAAWPALALRNGVRHAAEPARAQQGVLLDLLRNAETSGIASGAIAAGGALALVLAASVPVQMIWMAALGGLSPRDALARGLARTPMALAVSGAVLAIGAVALAIGCVPAYVVHAAASGPNARTHDLLVLTAAFIPLALGLTAAAWLDLARAASLRHGLVESLKRGWWSIRASGGTFAWVTIVRLLLGWPLLLLPLPPVAALVVLQTAAFAGTLVRARWLAEGRRHVMERGSSTSALDGRLPPNALPRFGADLPSEP